METKNICGKIPVELHEKVREELEGTEVFGFHRSLSPFFLLQPTYSKGHHKAIHNT